MREEFSRKAVPADKVPLLNFTVGDVFCRDRYLTSVINKLHKNGIVRLGHLVQFSEPDLFKIIETTSGNHDRIRNCLGQFGLELGMEVSKGSYIEDTRFIGSPRPH